MLLTGIYTLLITAPSAVHKIPDEKLDYQLERYYVVMHVLAMQYKTSLIGILHIPAAYLNWNAMSVSQSNYASLLRQV